MYWNYSRISISVIYCFYCFFLLFFQEFIFAVYKTLQTAAATVFKDLEIFRSLWISISIYFYFYFHICVFIVFSYVEDADTFYRSNKHEKSEVFFPHL